MQESVSWVEISVWLIARLLVCQCLKGILEEEGGSYSLSQICDLTMFCVFLRSVPLNLPESRWTTWFCCNYGKLWNTYLFCVFLPTLSVKIDSFLYLYSMNAPQSGHQIIATTSFPISWNEKISLSYPISPKLQYIKRPILNIAEILIKLQDDKEMEKQKLIPVPWISEYVTEMIEFWNGEKADGGNLGFLSSSLNKVKCYFVAKPHLQSSLSWWLKK